MVDHSYNKPLIEELASVEFDSDPDRTELYDTNTLRESPYNVYSDSQIDPEVRVCVARSAAKMTVGHGMTVAGDGPGVTSSPYMRRQAVSVDVHRAGAGSAGAEVEAETARWSRSRSAGIQPTTGAENAVEADALSRRPEIRHQESQPDVACLDYRFVQVNSRVDHVAQSVSDVARSVEDVVRSVGRIAEQSDRILASQQASTSSVDQGNIVRATDNLHGGMANRVATPVSQNSTDTDRHGTVVIPPPVTSRAGCPGSVRSPSVSTVPILAGNIADNVIDVNRMQRRSATIKLDKFDGSTALETHLAKLKNCANYYGWTDYEQKCHLIASLTGPAGQLLWTLSARDDATVEDVKAVLRKSFGDVGQQERFRAELHSRRRKPGESIQMVYTDIRRLLELSYPGETGGLLDSIGRDAFLSALGDPRLRIRVMDQAPSSMDQAYTMVMRMDAYSTAIVSEEAGGSRDEQKKQKVVRAVDDRGSGDDKRLCQLEGELANQKKEIQQQKSVIQRLNSEAEQWRRRAERIQVSPSCYPPAQSSVRSSVDPTVGVQHGHPFNQSVPVQYRPLETSYVPPVELAPQSPQQLQPSSWPVQNQDFVAQPPGSGWTAPWSSRNAAGADRRPPERGGYRGRARGRVLRPPCDPDVCRLCYNRGHWARNCPNRLVVDANVDAVHDNTANVNLCDVSGDKTCPTYLEIDVNGVKALILLDTGSQKNIFPRRMVPRAILTNTDVELFAANGSKIHALGAMRLRFKVNDLQLLADIVVTEDLDEPIFGCPFITEHRCQWNFATGEINIAGRTTARLKSKPDRSMVRRVYVREEVSIPPDFGAVIPVKMPVSVLQTKKSDWIVAPSEIRNGLLVSRTILGNDDTFAAVQILNLSNKTQTLRKGYFIGEAEPGFVISENANGFNSDLTERAEAERKASSFHVISDPNGGDYGDGGSLVGVGEDQNRVNNPSSAFLGLSKCSGAETARTETARPETAKAETVRAESARAETAKAETAATEAARAEMTVHRDKGGLDDPSICLTAESDDFSHLKDVIETLSSDLTEQQRKEVIELLQSYSDIFSKHEYDVGYTNLLEASIDTGPARPIAEPLRRHPKIYLDRIDEHVNKMAAANVIEPAASSWSSNVVLVSKKGSAMPRVTIDYRRLNELTYKDKFPLPHIQECLDALSGNLYFSTIDLSCSFWQCGVKEQDRDKTAFVTRQGQWRFRVLPMGLCNSPSIFARLMSLVLRGLTFVTCLVFIDDTVVIGKTFEQHLDNLKEVFQRFRQANLKLKPRKCHLFQKRVKFLGHVVSHEGVEVDEDKVAVVKAWQFPRNISELRSFLGLCNYYRSFVQNFGTVAEPLTQMLRKGVPVHPTEERLRAFEKLKQLLTSAPVLGLPRDAGEYVLDSDCSDFAASSVLSQWQDGQLRVLEFASRTLNPAERNYCTTRKELLALLFGLKYFRCYLLGRKFTCRVDHMALLHYRKMQNPTAWSARFLDYVADFDFVILHRPGAQHGNSDALSRVRPCDISGGAPCKQCAKRMVGRHVRAVQTCSKDKCHSDHNLEGNSVGNSGQVASQIDNSDQRGHQYNTRKKTAANIPASNKFPNTIRVDKEGKNSLLQRAAPAAAAAIGDWNQEYLRQKQIEDPNVAPVIKWLEASERPPWQNIVGASPQVISLWHQYDSLTMQNGCLYRIYYDTTGAARRYQYVLPAELKVPFLQMIHGMVAGHLKYDKSSYHVQLHAWWLGWKRDLRLFIRSCGVCESFHRGKLPKQARLKPTQVGYPAVRWSVDLCGEFPVSNGYKYIFTAICPFSKYAIAVPIRNKNAETVARVIVERIVLQWGYPTLILSDGGGEFENELAHELYRILGVHKVKTTAYRPSANGQIENLHRTLNSLLGKIIRENQKDWPQFINHVMFCYNTAVHSSTGFSPYFLMTGRVARSSIDLYMPDCNKNGDFSVVPFANDIAERLTKAFESVREHLKTTSEKFSQWYNRGVRPKTFAVGDRVRVYNPRKFRGRSPKWQSYFRDTATVKARLNDVTYLVSSAKWRSDRIVHVDKLKPIVEFCV